MTYLKKLSRLTLCSLAFAACGPSTFARDDGFFPAALRPEATTLVVRNEYIGAMDVYAVMGSTRTRIGSVPLGRTAEFQLPRTIALRPWIQFQIDPFGPAEPFTYQPVTLMPGSTIELAIAPALPMSSLAIVLGR